MKPQIGDRVKIKGYDPKYNGKLAFVIDVDGSYILVRPRWSKHRIDLLENEVELA